MNINFKRFVLFLFTSYSSFPAPTDNLSEQYQWWEKTLESKVSYSEFSSWLKSVNHYDRIAFRKHVQKKQYKTILDAACGVCIEYHGFKQDDIKIDYQGMDITPKLVKRAKQQGIPVVLGNIDNIPFDNNSFDICYARHILEHLSGFKTAMSELVRVASKEVIIIFINEPTEKERTYTGQQYGHVVNSNWYKRSEIINFIESLDKIKKYEWELKSILHLYL